MTQQQVSPNRVVEDDTGITLVTTDALDLDKKLNHEYNDLYLELESEEQAKIGTVAHSKDATGFFLRGANLIYYEAEVAERSLTDAETAWCENTILYSGENLPEAAYEVNLPPADVLREAILNENLDAFRNLTSAVPNHSTRDRLVQSLQKNIECADFRATKLSNHKGYPTNLPPEWDPESVDKSQDKLYDAAASRTDAHLISWGDTFNLRYYGLFEARVNHLGIHEPKLEPYELVALDVAEEDGLNYCRYCAGLLPEDDFLHVAVPTSKPLKLRVCDGCAEISNDFTDGAVAAAKDQRAKQHGGQRHLHGSFQ